MLETSLSALLAQSLAFFGTIVHPTGACMQVTAAIPHCAYYDALAVTPEEALIADYAPEIVGRFGFAADYDYRPAIHCGPVVRKGLAIQLNPAIARDWFEGFADWQARAVPNGTHH